MHLVCDSTKAAYRLRRPGELTIGRSADIFIADSAVSRKHAKLIWNSDGLFVEDGGSKHGTYLDDTRLEPSIKYAIAPSQRIFVGRAELFIREWYESIWDAPSQSLDNLSSPIILAASMQALYREIDKLAVTNELISLSGESGVGKEIVARYIHERSKRNHKPFIALNCGAVSRSLLESELFGHSKGSFTGAIAEHTGVFEQASDGTLFLDEVAELSPDAQVTLLRVLDGHPFRKVGGTKEILANVRLIAATNQPLTQMLSMGRIRADFFYRLGNVKRIPPLRERIEEIVPLAERFIAIWHDNYKTQHRPILDETAKVALRSYPWPGNIRQLKTIVSELSAIFGDEAILSSKHILHILNNGNDGPAMPLSSAEKSQAPIQSNQEPDEIISLMTIRQEAKRRCLMLALEQAGGNRTRACKIFGCTRPHFQALLKEHGIT